MKLLSALMLSAGMMLPSVALAAKYPRALKVNGLDCMETLGLGGSTEVWCRVNGTYVQMRQDQQAGGAVVLSLPSKEKRPAVGGLSQLQVDAIGDASVKYSWSAPLKWNAIGFGLAGLAFVGSDDDDLASVGLVSLGVGALSAVVAIIIDSSARSDLHRAVIGAAE